MRVINFYINYTINRLITNFNSVIDMKTIDLKKTVKELIDENPEIKDIMIDLGFNTISKHLNTMGRVMTIPKGSKLQSIPIEKVIERFENEGFKVINMPENIKKENKIEKEASDKQVTNDERLNLLKSYIHRVSDGEELETVQQEFKENFSDVSAVEIAQAEQQLIKDGFSIQEMQNLCDIHSVMFHGMTQEEKLEMMQIEMKNGALQSNIQKADAEDESEKILENVNNLDDEEIISKVKEYQEIKGHPLNILSKENDAIESLLKNINQKREQGNKIHDIPDDLEKLRTIAQHYGKKDELIFPLLSDKYGFSGPSNVMWGVEDEIRNDIKTSMDTNDEELLTKALKRADEMIYKEKNILFPLCTEFFTEEEWINIARDMPLYGPCLIDELPVWYKVIKTENDNKSGIKDDKIVQPGGTLTLKQTRSILNIIPMEITVLDDNNINVFFDEVEPKLFLRPKMALNREVFSCHPPDVTPMVKGLLNQFRSGEKESMHVIGMKMGQKVLINYYALRDEDGNYLGAMEAVLKLDDIVKNVNDGKMGPIDL